MTRLACELVVCANSQHVYQVISGFVLLHRARIVELSLRYDPAYRANLPTAHLAELRVTGGPTVAYDTFDGYDFANLERLDDYVRGVDVYFKRSFDANQHRGIEGGSRIRPLGLNYAVTVRHPFFVRLCATTPRRDATFLARMLTGSWPLDVSRFEDVPRRPTEVRVVFQTRAWDPAEVVVEKQRNERKRLNDMRAGCIRLLRSELGPSFRGGFMHTPYAREHFPDCLLDAAESGSMWRFMRIVKEADICIATTGLHGSNGWSLGEYVAASKAVVSQQLRYTVPAFSEGRNYLGFGSPAECAAKTLELASDPQRVYEMQLENYAYYHRFLRPDRLILNSLLLALRP